MTDQTAKDILQRQGEMESIRSGYEKTWEQVANYCAPDSPPMNWRGGRVDDKSNQAERQDRRSSLVYDNTIVSASERLTSGLESLITPQSEKWHGISTAEMDDEETEEEAEWAEGLRDFLFSIRYSSASNFVPAIQSVYANVVRFGPAYLYSEEGFRGAHIRYASIPVNEGFIARNRWGEVDIFHRRYSRTARELAQIPGIKLPKMIADMARDPAKSLEQVNIIQAVMPRNERRTYDLAGEKVYLDSEYVSYHVIESEETVALEKSFQSFPVACFNWRRYEGDVYGTSPTIQALTTVRELNAVRHSGLRALQQITDPATASMGSLDYVPVLNPGQNYEGLMSDQGEILVKPINTGQNPSYAFEYAGQRAEEVKDLLFVNLFQTLVANPQMTATEALIRQEEKGALLGPAGSVIQRGLGQNLDRELAILEAKGLYEEGSRFVPPASLAGKDVRPTFTSPLDVLRRSAEARDTMQLIQTAMGLAQADPSIMDSIDTDEALKVIQSAGRTPQRVFKRKEEVEEIRKARAEAQKAQQGMMAMQQAAATAKDAVPAMAQAQASGMLDGMMQ